MEEECRKINLEDKYKGALRKAKEVREDVHKRNNGCEPSIAECLAYDMQYVEQYVENLMLRYKELEVINKMQAYRISVIDERELIPKSKVKEKIEELDIRIGECCENIDKTVDEEREYWEKEKRDAIMQRFILQELLEGDK